MRFFCFVSVFVLNVWPKTTLPVPVWPRDAPVREYGLFFHIFYFMTLVLSNLLCHFYDDKISIHPIPYVT